MAVVLARRGQLRPDVRLRQRILRVVAAAAAMGLVLWVTEHALLVTTFRGMARLGTLAALVAIGLATFGAAAAVFGASDWQELTQMMRRRPAKVASRAENR
jgi:putative peptidoglycan lipid II flippase